MKLITAEVAFHKAQSMDIESIENSFEVVTTSSERRANCTDVTRSDAVDKNSSKNGAMTSYSIDALLGLQTASGASMELEDEATDVVKNDIENRSSIASGE